ncbi:MAG TPA: GntR family transcriptional regulator [Candidatus Limnocylindrales bacterium]|nr:GntR family transcriptional regulator [Candidatus Limnocylindrales bacterium]
MNQRQAAGSGDLRLAPRDVRGRRLDAHGDDLAYVVVHRRLEADILTGRLAPGERLAAERELGVRFGVARNTLRRALRLLASQRLVEPRGRQGWVVAQTALTEQLERPHGLTEWARRQGFEVTSVVRVERVRAANELEAGRLRIAIGAPVFELERVRMIDGVPLALDRSILHGRLVPALEGVDFATASLYSTLRERAGIISSRADVVLRAISADPGTAALLDVAPGAALLEVAETAFDQYGEPFEAATLLNRGDRYAYGATRTGDGVLPRIEVRRPPTT